MARATTGLRIAGFVLSLVAQLAMVALGAWLFVTDDPESAILLLLGWCVLGTLYAGVAITVIGRLAARRPLGAGSGPTRIEVGRTARLVSVIATILASVVGLTAATQVLALRDDPEYGGLMNVVGVWSMLLAWGFLHWGFAQLYYQAYYAAAEPPLRFPNTPRPGMVDFVYFSYTLGTSFAASDVETLQSRIRWRIVWHSILSFFFNGLIIVLALNTIMDVGR